MKIAFFDMDGTITNRDSLIHFIRYAHGYPRLAIGLLCNIHYLIAYKVGLYPNDRAKEKILAHFFGGWNEERFHLIAHKYSKNELDKITRPQAMEKIRWHQKQGHKTVVVSASIETWLIKWCAKYSLELISTQLQVDNGKLSGKFSTKNCHGAEKVLRIKKEYDLSEFETIYAYGDSSGDTEMLQLAHEKHFKPFR